MSDDALPVNAIIEGHVGIIELARPRIYNGKRPPNVPSSLGNMIVG